MGTIRTLALAGLLLAAGGAAAQTLLRQADGLGLNNAEVEAMTAAGATLYAGAQIAEPGTVADWTAQGGAAGTVTLEEVATRADGSPCVKLRYGVAAAGDAAPRSGALRRCRGADGVWRIAVE